MTTSLYQPVYAEELLLLLELRLLLLLELEDQSTSSSRSFISNFFFGFTPGLSCKSSLLLLSVNHFELE